MHNGSVIVRDKIERVELCELRAICWSNVVQVNLNPIVSVASHLFVPHSERVQDLVNWNSELRDRSHDGKSAKMPQKTAQIQTDIEPHRCRLYHLLLSTSGVSL